MYFVVGDIRFPITIRVESAAAVLHDHSITSLYKPRYECESAVSLIIVDCT